jgi:hypothetical protein
MFEICYLTCGVSFFLGRVEFGLEFSSFCYEVLLTDESDSMNCSVKQTIAFSDSHLHVLLKVSRSTFHDGFVSLPKLMYKAPKQ